MKALQNQVANIQINIKILFKLQKFEFKISFKEILPFLGGQNMKEIMQITPLYKIKEDIYGKNEFLLET